MENKHNQSSKTITDGSSRVIRESSHVNMKGHHGKASMKVSLRKVRKFQWLHEETTGSLVMSQRSQQMKEIINSSGQNS